MGLNDGLSLLDDILYRSIHLCLPIRPLGEPEHKLLPENLDFCHLLGYDSRNFHGNTTRRLINSSPT